MHFIHCSSYPLVVVSAEQRSGIINHDKKHSTKILNQHILIVCPVNSFRRYVYNMIIIMKKIKIMFNDEETTWKP